jgi:Glycosyl hydrolase family 92
VGGLVGKEGLDEYTTRGFLSVGSRGKDQVSRTLDFGFADFATSRAFDRLAEMSLFSATTKKKFRSDARRLMKRAKKAHSSKFTRLSNATFPVVINEYFTRLWTSFSYPARHVPFYCLLVRTVGQFDADHRLMTPRQKNGEIVPYFRDTEWGCGFVEGNAWHYR